MNLYLCTDALREAGLYVLLDFIMVHTYIVRRNFEAPAGVYDENCEALEAAGVRYCDETEE